MLSLNGELFRLALELYNVHHILCFVLAIAFNWFEYALFAVSQEFSEGLHGIMSRDLSF